MIALGLMAAHLFTLALAASSDMHRWFHKDADESGHVCAATAVLDGQLDSGAIGGFSLAGPLQDSPVLVAFPVQRFPQGILPSSPGERAPPVA